MKKIYLIRHAKSDWGNSLLSDFDRPLTDKGKRDAEKMGNYLKSKEIRVDRVYSSSAKRTRQTIKRICSQLGMDKDIITYDENLYSGMRYSIDYYISYLMGLKDKYNSIFFVGHNNIWSELVSELLGIDIGIIPTCSVVAIKFDCQSWKDIGYGKGKLDFHMTPKKLS